MKTKRLFNALLVAGFAAALAACSTKEQIEGNGLGFNDAEFKIELTKVGQTGATLTLSSSDAKAPFYGFLTDDLKSKSSELVEEFVDGMSDINTSVVWTKKKVLPISGLCQGGHPYRFIMTGLLPNGDIYHEPVEIVFTTEGEYVKNPAWVFAYPDPESDPSTVTLDGTTGSYILGVLPKADYEATTIKEIALKDIIEGSAKPATGNGPVSLPIAESGDYVVYIYGVTEEGYPTLEYQDFAITVGNLDFSAFDAFIGEWFLDGVEDDIVTIEEVKRGVSVLISGGFPDADSYEPIEATFSLATGELTVAEQENGKWSHPSYGVIMDCFSGITAEGFNFPFEDPAVAFTAKIDENGDIVCSPGKDAAGNDFQACTYVGILTEGAYAGYNLAYNAQKLPFKLTKEPAEPEEGYTAWIGTWYDEGANVFEVKKAKNNKSFTFTYFDQSKENPVECEAAYDPESGKLIISAYDLKEATKDEPDYELAGVSGSSLVRGVLGIATLAEDGKSFDLELAEGVAWFGLFEYREGYYTTDFLYVEGPVHFIDEIPQPTEGFLAWQKSWKVVRVEAAEEESHEATQEDVDAGLAMAIGDKVIDVEAQEEIVDVWTFAEKQVNSAYTLTGVESLDWAEVVVEYNSDEDGSWITCYDQEILESDLMTVYLSTTGYLTSTIIGQEGYYGITFYGEINEDGTATLYPDDYYRYGSKYYSPAFITFSIEGETGDYMTRWSKNPTVIPAAGLTITPIEEEEGGEEVGSASIAGGFRYAKPVAKAASNVNGLNSVDPSTSKTTGRAHIKAGRLIDKDAKKLVR